MATALTPAAAYADAMGLARDILAGDTRPYGTGYYKPHQWKDAAQYAVDSDDADEMLWMMAREAAWERGDLDDDCPVETSWSDADKFRMFGSFR